MKKALITGSRGFVGPYLKTELEQNGYVVYETDCQEISDSNYYYADITSPDEIKKVIVAVEPEYVYHLAGISSPVFAEEKPELTHNVNVKGTENVFDAVKENKKIKILAVGSSFVYGQPENLPIKESHPLNGKGAYAHSRIEQEKLIQRYKGEVDYVITRSFNHTGPNQPNIFIIPKIIGQISEIKKGLREKLVLGNINVRRDISDVRDVARAYRLLLEQNNFGIICNVCRGESVSLKEIIEYCGFLAELENIEVKTDDKFIKKDEVADIYGDNAYLKDLTGWSIKIDYHSMIENMYNHLIKM